MCLLLRSGFRLATLPYRPDWWSAAEMVVLLEGSPLFTVQRWSSVRVTIGFLVTSLTKALHPLIAQFGRVASSRKSPDGSKLLPFTDDRGHCAHWDLQCCRHFSVPFPRSVPQYNPVSEVYRQFLGLHGLVCALTCTVNCGTLYRRCVPFQIMSNQLNLPQVDSNQVVQTSQGWSVDTECTWDQLLSVMAKAVSTYVLVRFLFLINLQKILKPLFHVCHYGLLCV